MKILTYWNGKFVLPPILLPQPIPVENEGVNRTGSSPLLTLRIYAWFLLRYKRKLVFALSMLPALILVQNGFLPMVYSRVIDHLHRTNGQVPHFGFWVVLFVGLHLIVFATQRVTNYLWSKIEHNGIKDIEQYIFTTLLQQTTQFHTTAHAGGLVAQAKRFTGAFSALSGAFYNSAYALLIRLLVAFGFMLVMAPSIAIILLTWTAVYITSIFWLTKKKMHASAAAAAADSDMTAHLADTITNAAAVKLFASEPLEEQSYGQLSSEKYRKRRYDWRLSEIVLAWQSLLMIGLEAAVLILSVHLVQNGSFTLGQLALVQFFIAPILASLWQIANVFRQVETAFSESAEMTEILALVPAIKDPTTPKPGRIDMGHIVFDHIDFSYGEGEAKRYVFNDFNLELKAGETVGLVGPSGSGKSSLTKLLLRFTDVEKGRILIDGHAINDLPQAELRRQIACVPQEPQLFHRTIADNIRYARPDATDEEVVTAAKHARAHQFISKLPDGYDTMVGERGSKLSGGERQRIAIARAFLKNAPIIILDEATSALDSESEKLIQAAFAQLIEGRTAIVIAHRLSTIQDMDRIIVLKDGEVIEDAHHDSLVASRGLYYELWSHQTGTNLTPHALHPVTSP